jgi:predicted DNA-binding transcriptional regulator YafY
VVRRRQVNIEYESRGRQRSQRVVDPWGLVDKDDVWYLLAGTENGRRTFRVDRIGAVHPTDLVSERPTDFDPAQAWEQVVDEVEQRRSLLKATVLIADRLVPVLRGQFGRHCEVLDMLDDGRARVRIGAPMALSIAETLAGWGSTVEVEEPESVQAELARLGGELVARYARARH